MKVNGWLPDVEMEELKREVNNEGGAIQDTSRPTHMSGEITTANEREQEGGHSTSWEVEQLTDEEKGNFNTPNANMADHSVGARNELHESEASEASVFCFDNLPLKNLVRGRSSLFYFAMPTSF